MVTLPEGVTVCVGGKKYKGEIPKEICPEHLKPVDPAKEKKK